MEDFNATGRKTPGKAGNAMSENGRGGDEEHGAREQQTPSDSSAAYEGPASVGQPPGSPTSERKKESNRENAKKSTGPKTEAGKHNVRVNPLQHGFYATDAVMAQAGGWEHVEEFSTLFEELRRDWNPQGPTELSLVHTIAVSDWRIRRGYRSEVGELRRTALSLLERKPLDSLEHHPFVDAVIPQVNREEGARLTTGNLEARLLLLSNIRDEVERQGYISATSQEALDKSFGKQASSLANAFYGLSCLARRRQSSDDRDSPDSEREKLWKLLYPKDAEKVSAEQCKELLLRQIDVAMQILRVIHEDIEKREAREHIATLMAHNLPSREYVDKLVRYEAALERKKEKAIKLLLELQARRKGREK